MTCNDTKLVLSSAWYWGSNAIQLVLAPLALSFNILLIVVLRRCVLLHVNVRYLLINLSLCSMVASGYLLEKAATTLVYQLIGRVCQLELTSLMCYIREGVYVLFKLPVLGSMLALGVERVYSTRRAESYVCSESPLLALVLLLVLWSLAAGCIAALLATAPPSQEITYCNALFVFDQRAIEALAVSLLPLELAGVSLYTYIWTASVRLSSLDLLPACLKTSGQQSFSLASRLQHRHNVAITAMMLPSVVFHALCWTSILGFALAQVNLHQFSVETHLLVSQYLFYGFALAHMTVHPVLCLWNCDMIRWELAKMCPRLQAWFPSVFQHPAFAGQQSHQVDRHFELLNIMWEKHKPTRRDRRTPGHGTARRDQSRSSLGASCRKYSAVEVQMEHREQLEPRPANVQDDEK